MIEPKGAQEPSRTEGWRAQLLAHRPIVNVRQVEQMGTVADIVFDPQSSQLAGVLVQPARPEAALLGMARRAFGGALGLTFVAADHVIALNGEVVTVDLEEGSAGRQEPLGPLPRVSKIWGFAVVTTRGQRLGRFIDLLLDEEGRHIVGYLVEPGGRGAAPRRDPEARPTPERTPTDAVPHETGIVEAPAGEPASNLVVVSASPNVRVGRDLIVVAEHGGLQRPAWGTAASSYAPPWSADADQPTEASRTPAWYHHEADAPTEQARH
jgi:sporulation protein YlmC with PRC-barrel domain